MRGRRFVVASYTPAAAYAGWLLRQMGAEVEHETALDPETLGAFLCEGARFSPSPALAPVAGEVVITDAPITDANRDLLARAAKGALVVWITPWGVESPWAGRPASDLVLHAAGGWMSAVWEPEREPLGPPGSQGRMVAGLFGAIAAAAPAAFGESVRSQGLVDLPVVEAVATTTIYDAVAFQYLARIRERAGTRFARTQPTIVTLPCADGYIGLHVALHRQWLRLCELIGHPEMVEDPLFAQLLDRAENIEALDSYLLPWLQVRTRFEAYHELQRAGIPASAHPTMAEVLDSPQLAARGSWHLVRTPEGRSYKVPGPPARALAEASVQPAAPRIQGPWEPGRVRVVDLSMGWAGPLAGHVLACYGADVIKVESHRRFDWWRGSRPPGDDPSLALHERSHVFNSANRGKRGITLDLANRAGNDLARKLIATADVVVENFAPGAIEKLGLTYDRLARDNPGLIMLRQPAFGSTGPEASYLAFGNTIEGMSGLSPLIGYEEGPPTMMSNALGDPVSGLNGALAVMAALAGRGQDGRGRCIEAAQLEGFLPFVTESLIEYQRTGEQPARRGNDRPGAALCGAFLCAGEDEWVAIEASTDDEWARLADVVAPGSPGSGNVADLAGRSKKDRLAAWTRFRDRDTVVERLQVAGVPCAPVNNEAGVLAGEPFATAGLFVPEEREYVGLHFYPALPVRVDGERLLPSRPAPTLGQHNDDVFRGMGLMDEDLERLRLDGVIGEWPI